VKEREAAIALALRAGAILRAGRSGNTLDYELKGVIDPVTQVDRRSQALIVEGLHMSFPGDSILAEEGEHWDASTPSKARWIIDPLDGTTNYIKGYPLAAVSIGLEKDGELVLGVVFNPFANELFVGEHGQGATLNGHPIHVSSVAKLGQALLASGFPYDAWTATDDNTRAWQRMVKRCLALRCDGSAALDLCHVACGRLDGYWERGLAPWDTAAGVVIVREAGGLAVDYAGGNGILVLGEVVAGNAALVREIRKIIDPR
jgi:myo-inositol-1(or 4)-monophosphatase